MLIVYNFVNSMVFSQLDHPLAMTLIIITQTLIICLTIGLLKPSYWFSYILFLVFLGGMLVLFVYTTTLASNEIFSVSIMELMIISGILLCLLGIVMFLDHFFQFLSNNDMLIASNNSIINYSETDNLLTKLYNTSTSMITLLLMSYLLLTLIVIVKITDIFSGPLRQKN
uniref:NADH-ubiquinone oxidoreductase chain 6 n=1 Tax=Conocephalus maculatus TaxID=578476 RepID=A0A0A0VD26_9ORTH|nr:NADH dehydrogenase subunit 6 [Conocephalus maculatus]AIW64928.1 NADH dehydrogenase subunit 6 [Conocephalus maculatus]